MPHTEVTLDQIWQKVILPDLCQGERGIWMRNKEDNTLKYYFVALLMINADHMELTALVKWPGTYL